MICVASCQEKRKGVLVCCWVNLHFTSKRMWSLCWEISSSNCSASLTLKMKTGRLCLTVFTNVVSQFFWNHLQHNSSYKKAMLLLNVLCYLATIDKGSDISGKIGSSCVIPIFFFYPCRWLGVVPTSFEHYSKKGGRFIALYVIVFEYSVFSACCRNMLNPHTSVWNPHW